MLISLRMPGKDVHLLPADFILSRLNLSNQLFLTEEVQHRLGRRRGDTQGLDAQRLLRLQGGQIDTFLSRVGIYKVSCTRFQNINHV